MQGIRQLVLNSKNRIDQSGSTSDCTFEFNAYGATSAEVISFQCPSTQYNVTSTNNKVYFNDGADRQFTMTPGNYSIYDFIAELQTQFNALSAGYTVTYSDILMKITITNATLPFQLLFGTNTSTRMSELMGFQNIDYPASLTQTSDKCINLSLPLYICCTIDEFGITTKTTDDTTATFIFPNFVNGGDISMFSENTDYKQCARINESNIQSLHIRFTIPGGNPLELNGGDWMMVLRLCYC